MTTTPPLSPQRFERVEAHVRALVESGALPHAQWLAARDGEVLHRFTMGRARADGTPLREDAVFRIASMTKAVTAFLFLMLWEEGRVGLHDPLTSVLPELADLRVYDGGKFAPFATRAATRQPVMLDLLLHTAGFSHGFQQNHPVDQAYWTAGVDNFKAVKTADGIVAALAGLPLLHDPGTAFTYSIATDLIGIIIERLTGRPLDQLFAERIFRPLGMTDTGLVLRDDQADRFTDAWAEHPRRGHYVYDTALDGLWSRPLTFASGGGGLLSTTADYHRFCRMLLGEGALDGVRLLKPETMAMMVRNHLPDGQSIGAMAQGMFAGDSCRAIGQGLGIAVTLPGGQGARPAGEMHWTGLFSTFYSVVPSERLILIFMTQLLPLKQDDLPDALYRILMG
ncbi:beta-lactamase family protein [Sphingobium sufflavum]|uniref:serine hydrolase domain-containing protein n=1 Tax=Sphingobium sufflavum TaxID=1129547 RepID=UPI001F42D289|nr:serine hydrolase domain-containing protein [Sphingobium sufflavum]MCE7797801.1 beta-lactamase family protein [Sphingobium sufflavum]